MDSTNDDRFSGMNTDAENESREPGMCAIKMNSWTKASRTINKCL